MGMLSGYSEPPAIDDEAPREERPSYDDLLTANETLARKVALLQTRVNVLEGEKAELQRRIETYQRQH